MAVLNYRCQQKKKKPTPNSHPVLAVVSQYSAGHDLRKASLRNTPLPVQRNSTSRRLTYDSLCKLTGPQLFQHKTSLFYFYNVESTAQSGSDLGVSGT